MWACGNFDYEYGDRGKQSPVTIFIWKKACIVQAVVRNSRKWEMLCPNECKRGEKMKLGFGQRDITPDFPCRLAGYAADRKMIGVHDKIFVKVALAENEGVYYTLINYDLIAVDSLLMERVKELCRQQSLPEDNLYFTAIHTHSGPMGVINTETRFLKSTKVLMGEVNQKLIAEIAVQTTRAMKEAYQNMGQATFKLGIGKCQGIGKNRISSDFPGNEDLLLLEAKNGYKKAIFTLFACHPTVLNAGNTLCSADFPGEYNDQMIKNGYDISFYMSGSCGDISTRFTRQGTDFSETERLGKLLAAAAGNILPRLDDWEINQIHIGKINIELKAKVSKTLKEAEEKRNAEYERLQQAKKEDLSAVALRVIENAFEAAEADWRYAQNKDNQSSYTIAVDIVKLNKEIFIGIPGELFSALSNPLQDGHTHFINYMNGYLMYFADEYAYDHNLYEANSSLFAKGESEKMMREIEKQIREWRKEA